MPRGIKRGSAAGCGRVTLGRRVFASQSQDWDATTQATSLPNVARSHHVVFPSSRPSRLNMMILGDATYKHHSRHGGPSLRPNPGVASLWGWAATPQRPILLLAENASLFALQICGHNMSYNSYEPSAGEGPSSYDSIIQPSVCIKIIKINNLPTASRPLFQTPRVLA